MKKVIAVIVALILLWMLPCVVVAETPDGGGEPQVDGGGEPQLDGGGEPQFDRDENLHCFRRIDNNIDGGGEPQVECDGERHNKL